MLSGKHHVTSSGPSRRRIEPRHLIVLACFLATLSAYVERVGFSIAYTAMAKTAQVDEATKGTVLSAFYWGYGISQVGTQLVRAWVFTSSWYTASYQYAPAGNCVTITLVSETWTQAYVKQVHLAHMLITGTPHADRRHAPYRM